MSLFILLHALMRHTLSIAVAICHHQCVHNNRSMSYAWQAVLASHEFHTRLSRGILSAPMTFFDTTPIGRILNRFAKDMDAVGKFKYASNIALL
jgi:ABC-type multidrug transport system fused ATPase/permease subunit